uniref:Uncharacterized protein n=1 Tax=Rhizophora mucronata TaxID=61149 RepID=A0A2P2QBE4_RHIMU
MMRNSFQTHPGIASKILNCCGSLHEMWNVLKGLKPGTVHLTHIISCSPLSLG